MMSWKLLLFIVVLAIVLVFIGFNLDNRCDISVVFMTFKDVPVVITILSAYILGLFSALVLAVRKKIRKKSPSTNRKGGDEPGIAQAEPEGSAKRDKSSKRQRQRR